MVSPAGGWYVGKIAPPPTRGPELRRRSVALDVPAGGGYRVYVYYRAVASGDPWTHLRLQPRARST